MKLISTLIAAAAIGLLAATSSSAAAPVTLTGTVGPGFTITLKQGLKTVKTLKAGTYTFTIHDKSPIHNFVVEGPGVARDITTPSFVGTKVVTLKLRHGKYKFYCRPHESQMFGFVTVT